MENTWDIKKNAYGYHDVNVSTDVEGEVVVDSTTGKAEKKEKKTAEEVLSSPTLNKSSTVIKQYVVDYTSETYEPLMEYEVGGLDYRYVYGNDRLSVDIKGVTTSSGNIIENGDHIRLYYHMDYLGTVDYLTSPVSQKIVSWTHYNEWGEITHNAVLKCGQREIDLVKRYATHDYDSVLGQYYAKARFYDAETRRFTAKDPVLDASRYDIKDYVKDPTQLVQYLYVKNSPLIYIDIRGEKYSLAEGTIAHLTIEAYIKYRYPTALFNKRIYGISRTLSGYGYADVIVPNKMGGYDIYEIKSDQYKTFGIYYEAGIEQLESYVNATKSKYSPAVKGTEIEINGTILPYLPDNNKVIKVSHNFTSNPGMIFYTISKKKKSHAVEEAFVTETLRQKTGYYQELECEHVPIFDTRHINIDTYDDLDFNISVDDWLKLADCSLYYENFITYTKVKFADGKTLYRCEGLGPTWLYWGANKIGTEELLMIYNGKSYYMGPLNKWTEKPTVDLLKIIPIIPAPGGAPSTVPAF